MAQKYLKFGNYTCEIMPDEDGYTLQFATTSTSNSGRTMRGNMINTPLFTVEAYNLKWTDIPVSIAQKILKEVIGKAKFQFYHFSVIDNEWKTGEFYVANINAPPVCLVDGEELLSELSFQVTCIDPIT